MEKIKIGIVGSKFAAMLHAESYKRCPSVHMHSVAAIDNLDVHLTTGPLPSGNYELRTRIKLEEGLLPAPMQLPAMFSSQWRHDSEWSVWPFKVSV